MNARSRIARCDLPGLTLEQAKSFLLNGCFIGGYKRNVIYSDVRGNVIWCVEEITHRDATERKLCAYVLESTKGTWSFSSHYEGRITHLSCPLNYLDEVPEKDPRWRRLVRLTHADLKISA